MTSDAQARQRPRWLELAAWVGLCMAVGIIAGLLFKPGAWYAALDKPFFNPPSWLFAPVWTMLYIAMGVAAWRIGCLPASAGRNQALRQFGVQLALNAAWTPVFFGAQSLVGGWIDHHRADGVRHCGDDTALPPFRQNRRVVVGTIPGMGGVRQRPERRLAGTQRQFLNVI